MQAVQDFADVGLMFCSQKIWWTVAEGQAALEQLLRKLEASQIAAAFQEASTFSLGRSAALLDDFGNALIRRRPARNLCAQPDRFCFAGRVLDR